MRVEQAASRGAKSPDMFKSLRDTFSSLLARSQKLVTQQKLEDDSVIDVDLGEAELISDAELNNNGDVAIARERTSSPRSESGQSDASTVDTYMLTPAGSVRGKKVSFSRDPPAVKLVNYDAPGEWRLTTAANRRMSSATLTARKGVLGSAAEEHGMHAFEGGASQHVVAGGLSFFRRRQQRGILDAADNICLQQVPQSPSRAELKAKKEAQAALRAQWAFTSADTVSMGMDVRCRRDQREQTPKRDQIAVVGLGVETGVEAEAGVETAARLEVEAEVATKGVSLSMQQGRGGSFWLGQGKSIKLGPIAIPTLRLLWWEEQQTSPTTPKAGPAPAALVAVAAATMGALRDPSQLKFSQLGSSSPGPSQLPSQLEAEGKVEATSHGGGGQEAPDPELDPDSGMGASSDAQVQYYR